MILACCSIDLKILPSSHVNKSKFLDFEWIVGRIEGSEWLEVWRNRQRLLSAPEYSSDLTKRLRKYPAVCSRMGFGLARSSMKSLSQTVGRGTWHLNVWHLLSTSEKSNDLLSHLKIIIGSHPLYETTASPRRYIDTNYNWSLFPRHAGGFPPTGGNLRSHHHYVAYWMIKITTSYHIPGLPRIPTNTIFQQILLRMSLHFTSCLFPSLVQLAASC